MISGTSAEDRLIGWLRAEIGRRGLPDYLGDDVAWLNLDGNWAVSADQQVEGTHFRPGLPAGRLGRRLVAVNLSDLAAAGVAPGFAIATIAAPTGFEFRPFFRGVLDSCERYGLILAGGDLASAPRVSVILTVFGRRPPRGRRLGRDGARPGDVLWLGGSVGESALGRALLDRGAVATAGAVRLPGVLPQRLRGPARTAIERHLEPAPQLELGSWLGRRRRAAAIDVSDGVLLDLERLARASAVVCELDAAALPKSPRFDELARALGRDPNRLALTGGEDYVLLFALPSGIRSPRDLGATPVGRVVARSGNKPRRWVRLVGAEAGAGAGGWDHLRSPPRGSR